MTGKNTSKWVVIFVCGSLCGFAPMWLKFLEAQDTGGLLGRKMIGMSEREVAKLLGSPIVSKSEEPGGSKVNIYKPRSYVCVRPKDEDILFLENTAVVSSYEYDLDLEVSPSSASSPGLSGSGKKSHYGISEHAASLKKRQLKRKQSAIKEEE